MTRTELEPKCSGYGTASKNLQSRGIRSKGKLDQEEENKTWVLNDTMSTIWGEWKTVRKKKP